LEYRRQLNIQKLFPLGTELEVAGFNILESYQKNVFQKFPYPYLIDTNYQSHRHSDYQKWLFTYDSSIMQNKKGVELISPISKLDPSFLNALEIVTTFLKEHHGYIDSNCAQHIHYSFLVFYHHLEALKRFLLLVSYYEPEIQIFLAGEASTLRPKAEIYAGSITQALRNLHFQYQLFQESNWEQFIAKLNLLNRSYGLNFREAKTDTSWLRNTVEIRYPNGSLNPIILENNIYFIYKLIECSFQNINNQELLEWWLVETETPRLPSPEKAYELSKMLCQSKEDFAYFDWQYSKRF